MDLKTVISDEMRIVAGQSFKEREFWLNTLTQVSVVSNFHNNIEENINGELDFSSLEFKVNSEISSKLFKISNNSDKRLFIILKACLDILLYKYSGNKSIISTTSVEKQEKEADFINTILPLLTVFDEQMSFKELVLQVKDCFFKASENQNFPLYVLFEELNPTGNSSDVVLPFDVGVILDKIHDIKYLKKLNLNIVFNFFVDDDCLKCSVHMNKHSYDNDRVQIIAKHFITILESITSNLNILIKDIDILSKQEKEMLLIEYNNTDYNFSNNKRLIEIFQDIAEQHPRKTALCFNKDLDKKNGQKDISEKPSAISNEISFESLNNSSNRLARLLIDNGVKENMIVALLFERSVEMIEAILAAMKLGAIYLPIDPSYPAERINYILNDSNPDLILTTSNYEKINDSTRNVKIIKTDQVEINNYTCDNINVEIKPTNPIYIIYTSGSTGRPKGVLVNHESVENTILNRLKKYQFNGEEVILQLFSYAFDGFVTSFFTPLLAGSKIVLPNETEILDVSKIVSLIGQNHVTHFISIPNLYNEIVNNLKEKDSETLKIITLAGDKVQPNLIKKSNLKFPHIEIVQEYGVTEGAVLSTINRNQNCTSEISIGKPIDNTKILLLDQNNNLQPYGVSGIICLEGVGLAQGYLNKPELTHSKFIETSYYNGSRIFITGDIAKWLPSGNLQFIGRNDNQVKIRGFRIEVGEVEEQINKLENVEIAVVIVSKDENEDNYLTAFIKPIAELSTEKIREVLIEKLPAYFIPRYIIMLDKFPYTPTGKIDRKALIYYKPDEFIDDHVITPPQNDLQESLLNIWMKELNVQEMGIKHNYFNIGGDSIKSIRLIHSINEELNYNLQVVDLYTNNTVEKLAEFIEGAYLENISSNNENSDIISELDEFKNEFLNKMTE